jgi:hypothetical protein
LGSFWVSLTEEQIYGLLGLGVGEDFGFLSVLGSSAFFHSDKGRWTAFLKSKGTRITGKFLGRIFEGAIRLGWLERTRSGR